jgi:phosphoribosylanthranilate isomerase
MSDLFVKICGITNLEDALFSVEPGADALGFIFYDQSPRCVRPEAIGHIVGQLPESVAKVGVFVNPSVRDVSTICQHIKLTAIQVHGNQTEGELRKLRTSIIKAFQVDKEFDVEQLCKYSVDAFLLDAFVKGKAGGTKVFDRSRSIGCKGPQQVSGISWYRVFRQARDGHRICSHCHLVKNQN